MAVALANNAFTAKVQIVRECIPGLVEVLRWEGIEAVRYALWDMTSWQADFDPFIWRSRAMEEQKKAGWEMWARMEKILTMVLHEVYNQEVEEAVDALAEGFESFYGKVLKAAGDEDAKTD